jgi:crotonobetainyl-CoA:carnitine CoA-transferase CaiB-like acyl-CoA transferase
MQALEGLRVLELGEMVAAAYGAKLMADLGADVVKVEPPQGDPARARGPFPGRRPDPEASGLFLYLNSNKRSVTLDPERDRGELDRLVAWADILIHNFPRRRMPEQGVDYERFRSLNPRLVMCSITPFGLTGPHSGYNAYEITTVHGGGWAWLSPGASDRPDLPPLKPNGHQADFQGGLAGALAALAAFHRARETGQGEHIDLSMQAFVASFLEQNFVYYTYKGLVASRLGKRFLHPWGMYPCKDGMIFLVVIEQDQLTRLYDLIGNPEWTTWEIFKTPFSCAENADVLRMQLEESTKQWTVMDLFRAGQEKRVCFAPVLNMADLAGQAQLRERGFFVEVDHATAGRLPYLGPPYHLKERWWSIRRPAPRLGEHNAEVLGREPGSPQHAAGAHGPRSLPLAGIRVADFSWAWAGPFCAMHLAHLGAEVIRVESNARLDLGRRLPVFPDDVEPGPNRSGYFNQWNQGKKSILLDLRRSEALEVARKLIARCDVVVENFATGVMEKLGLGYDDLTKLRPDIILASISGYGHTGPQRLYMGYGPAIVPLSGLASLTGYEGSPPQEVGISYGDPNGGINAAVAICAALVARSRTGRGQHIDVSLWEALTALLPEGWMEYAMNGAEPARKGDRDPWMSPHNCFRAQGEDEWVTLACGNDDEWRSLARAVGRVELAEDPRFATAADRKRNEDELEQILTAWTRERDKWEVTRTLQEAGVAAFPSMNAKDLAEDRHLNERGFFARLPHAEVGARTHAGIPWQLANSPNGVRSPAPLLGEHTDEVLRDLLGYSAEEIGRLREAQILY